KGRRQRGSMRNTNGHEELMNDDRDGHEPASEAQSTAQVARESSDDEAPQTKRARPSRAPSKSKPPAARAKGTATKATGAKKKAKKSAGPKSRKSGAPTFAQEKTPPPVTLDGKAHP